MTKYTVVRHPQLGYRHIDPLPSPEDIEEFHRRQYYDLIERGRRAPEVRRALAGGDEAEDQRAWLRDTLYTDIAEQLERSVPNRRVVEVGPGSGDFLEFLSQSGFEALGVEPSSAACEGIRARHLEAEQGMFEDVAERWAALGRQPAGAVVIFSVLEQVRDPMRFLTAARSILAEDGVLVWRIGNDFNPLQLAACEAHALPEWWVSPPDTINHFDKASAETVLRAAGFDVVHVQSDFPMEVFLLMGEIYVGQPDIGQLCHAKRVRFERSVPAALRRSLYEAFARLGIGRCLIYVARRDRSGPETEAT